MKKTKIIAGFIILSALFLNAGCSSGDDNSSSNSSSEKKHEWKADGIEVTPNEQKYSAYNSILLAGDYSKADFVVNERDSHYINGTFANWDGYSEQYNKNVIADTTISVDGVENAEGKFTIESLKKYKIKFTYKGLSKELEVTGITEGSIVPSSSDVKGIAGNKYSEVNTGEVRGFSVAKIENSFLSKNSLSTDTVYIKDATTGNNYSFFAGPDENNLTKLTILSFMDYEFKTNEKIMKIYHENITTASAATTGAYTINLTVTPLSGIQNAKASFKYVDKGEEISLLDVIYASGLVTVYDGTDSLTANNVGQIKMTEVTNGVKKLKAPFTLEIYDNKELTGTAVATINSSTTSADKWTPGEGADFPTYNTYRTNDKITYIQKIRKVYYVKIIYNDGVNSFASSNTEKTYPNTEYKYYPFASVIEVR